MARWLYPLLLAGCGRFGFDLFDEPRDADAPSSDLCADIAGEQLHDEDGDGIGDECDACPHIPGRNEDRDQDGVGDACDPNPDVPGEQIRAFVTFADGTPAGWTATYRGPTGDFTYADDTARVDLVGGDVAFLTIPDPGVPTLLVDTRLVVEAKSANATGNNTARNFAIVDAYELTPDTGVMYGPVYDYNQPDAFTLFILQVTNSAGNGRYAETLVSTDFSYGTPYELRFTRHGGSERTTILDGADGMHEISANRALPQGGVLGIRTRGLRVAFDYVIVIY